jgi:hypothetical protein
MSGHKEKAIIDIINGSSELQDKWQALTLKMEKQIKEQFEEGFGVPLPTFIMCQLYHLDTSLTFVAHANVKEYEDGALALINTSLKSNWPAIALDVIDTVANIAKTVIGSGSIKVGVTADGHRVEEKGEIFYVAVYTAVQHCSAKDWKSKTDFYAASHILAVWSPTADREKIINAKLSLHPNESLKLVGHSQ